MTLRWYYSVDDTTALDITERVRTPDGQGVGGISVGSHAEEGSGWAGNLEVDDPAGDLILKMYRRIWAIEDAEAVDHQVIGNWFITDLDVVRMDPRVLASRRWIVTMADENSLLERLILVGSDGDRPAETDIDRVRWLLTTTELSFLNPDETYIDVTTPVDMDANDYIGQNPSSVLSDCSQQSEKNYWVIFREDLTPNDFSLAYFNANLSTLYPSSLSLTNVASEVGAGVYAISQDTRLHRMGARIASGEYLSGSFPEKYVYGVNTTTRTLYGPRDISAPAVNLKTATLATARLNQHLLQMTEPDDEVTTTITVPEDDLNGAMHGMSIPFHATHLPNYLDDSSDPGYATGTTMRIKQRTVTQVGPKTFEVELVLTPMTPQPVVQFYTDSWPLGGCLTSSWDLPPGEGNLLIAFAAQRGNPSAYQAGVVPIGNAGTPGTCDAGVDVAGTEWTYIEGHKVATSAYENGVGGPITMAYRDSEASEPQITRWGGVGGTSEHMRVHHVEIAGYSGAPTIVETTADQVTSGSVFPLATIVITGPGIIVGGFSYDASGPSDGASASFVMVARSPAIDWTEGYAGRPAYGDYYWPNSWFGYIEVTAAMFAVTDTYTITLDRSAVPRRNQEPYGSIVAFWPL